MDADLTGMTPARFRAIYFALADAASHAVLLDSCGWSAPTGGRYAMAFGALHTVRVQSQQLVLDDLPPVSVTSAAGLWAYLQSQLDPQATGFGSGWIGTLGYELNHLLEPAVAARLSENPMGDLYFVRFRHRVSWVPGMAAPDIQTDDPTWREAFLARWSETENQTTVYETVRLDADPEVSLDADAFAARVERLQDHIRQGDLYQANLSIRFRRYDVPERSLAGIYERLVTRNPSPFSGVFKTPLGTVLSNSPERLVAYAPETGIVETRPIAGTRGRGTSSADEARIAATLQTDPKEQAEHTMLVDLARNDLGRVCEAGSVHVPEAGVLERYSHVTHLVSQVEGRLAPGKTPWDILTALFPCGTITGCPKIRCMQILAGLEPVPRGLYTGSLGYIDADGRMDFNILIRSLFHTPAGILDSHAGAGIVADSVAAWEYRECHRKAEAIQGVLRP